MKNKEIGKIKVSSNKDVFIFNNKDSATLSELYAVKQHFRSTADKQLQDIDKQYQLNPNKDRENKSIQNKENNNKQKESEIIKIKLDRDNKIKFVDKLYHSENKKIKIENENLEK